MGNTLTSPQTSSEILNKYWLPLPSGLFKNKATLQVIQEKKLAFRTQDEMKYVFNCLLKRINNYHPSVIKIMYLRKFTESSPLCDCGKKYVILVYVEHVPNTLKQFVNDDCRIVDREEPSKKVYDQKCSCISILKAAAYLKERYGAFRVTESNVWIQVAKNLKEIRPLQRNALSPESKSDLSSSNFKVKLWISTEEQQNFPDQSCQEKQMVLSIVELIQHTLVPSRLCKCYASPENLDKYLTISKLKDLDEKVKQDHSNQNESVSVSKNLSTVEVNKQPVQFQRTIRSFSSNEPGNHVSHGSHPIINENSQLAAQRKYTSIEYVRKQPVEYNSVASEKKPSKAPQMTSQFHQFFSPTAKPLLLQQPPKHQSFQFAKNNETLLKNDHSLTKNEYKAVVKFQVPPPVYHTEKAPQTIVPSKQVQAFNPKLKYRHGNGIYNRPIIGIADVSGEVSTNMPSITISSQPSHHLTPNQEKDKKSPFPSVNNVLSERDSGFKDDSKVSKINLEGDLSKKYVEISLDKGTNPTDRSKIEVSSKSQEKKQLQAINSSRKNISINPISLDSTNAAPEPLKTVLHSFNHNRKPTSTPVSGELQMPNVKEPSVQQDKSKKQSAQSRKSEKNYITYQINLTSSKTKEEPGKFFPRKKSSQIYENQSLKHKGQKSGQVSGQREKSYSFVNKIQTLTIATPNGDLGRLRQSQYIISGQNSLLNSKSVSASDSQPLKDEKPFESLEQIQIKFPTLQNLQNYEDIGIQRSQSHLFIEQDNSQHAKAPQRDPELQISYTKIINLNSYKQSREESIVSNNKSSNISINEGQKLKSKSFSSHGNNPRAPVPTQELQNILNDKISSMVMKENQQILDLQKSLDEEYKVKVIVGNEKEKMHHKKMSNPTFDKQYMKSKALKEEFGQLLGDPKDNASRALTESKDKLKMLDNNEGRETYSIYNESEYNTSEQASKQQSQHENNLTGSGSGHPPLPNKENNKQSKWRKPFSKQELEKEMEEKKEAPTSPPNQQTLRLTSSGHEDNSIKQKVRNKKAEFAELKNEMNSLLL